MSEFNYTHRIMLRIGRIREEGNFPSKTDRESLFHKTAVLYAALGREADLRHYQAEDIQRFRKGILNIMPARVRRSPFDIKTYASSLPNYEVEEAIDRPRELVRV
jgi:hypothetical protein